MPENSQNGLLADIFRDPRFREIRKNCWFGSIDGARIGVVLATRNPEYNNFAVNKPELERLLAAKRDGKIDEAHVVTANVNGTQRVFAAQCRQRRSNRKLKRSGSGRAPAGTANSSPFRWASSRTRTTMPRSDLTTPGRRCLPPRRRGRFLAGHFLDPPARRPRLSAAPSRRNSTLRCSARSRAARTFAQSSKREAVS
jgi:hypothetical protein